MCMGHEKLTREKIVNLPFEFNISFSLVLHYINVTNPKLQGASSTSRVQIIQTSIPHFFSVARSEYSAQRIKQSLRDEHL